MKYAKRFFGLMLTALLLTVCTLAAAEAVLVLDREELNMAVGKGFTFDAHVEGAKVGKYPAYEWESANPEVAKVNGGGFVKAVSEGRTTVSCTLRLEDGTVLRAECPVFCYVPVAAVSCAEKSIEVCAGKTRRLQVTVMPREATDGTMDYRSSDETVCTVDETGLVTALRAGKCSITYSARYGKASGKVSVTVPTFSVAETELTLSEAAPYSCAVEYAGTDAGALTAVSKNQEVLTCTLENGTLVLTPVGVGQTAVVLNDPVGRSKLTLQVTVEAGAVSVKEQIRVTSVTFGGGRVQILCRNRTGKKLTSMTWRLRFLDAAGRIYGATDLADYARGREETAFTETLKKPLKSGNTVTLSYKLPDFGYTGAASCEAAVSAYTTEDGKTVRFSENELYWLSSLGGGQAAGTQNGSFVPLTAEEQALAAGNTIGWKARLLTPEHAKRLGVPRCGLLLYGFYAHNNAEKNGFKMYDVLLEVNGLSFADDPYLPERVLGWHAQGDPLTFTVYRSGETLTLSLN